MNGKSLQGAWKIAAIMGIPIRVHFTWLIVFGLITWSLSSYYFPSVAPELPAVSYWIKGILAALLLFASVAFHELAHSFVARKYKIAITSITLFIFGGVAEMKGEPPHPRAEFWMALAGPVSSLVLSAFFALLHINVGGSAGILFSYLAQVNFLLAVFNLIPGFPMDGGRVLRSVLWKRRGDYFYATRKASSIGQSIALFFILYGLLSIFMRLPGGLWLILIGWFLHRAAQASYQQVSLQETLSGIKIKDIMVKDMVTINPSMTVNQAVNEYFLRYGYGGFSVLDDGRFLGIITLKEVKHIPRERWGEVRVSDITVRHEKKWEVSPDDDAMKALELMIREDKGRVVVTEKERITGLITRNGIAQYVQLMGK